SRRVCEGSLRDHKCHWPSEACCTKSARWSDGISASAWRKVWMVVMVRSTATSSVNLRHDQLRLAKVAACTRRMVPSVSRTICARNERGTNLRSMVGVVQRFQGEKRYPTPHTVW